MSVLASSTRRFRRACPCQQFALIRVLLRPLFSLFKQPRSLASTRAISAHFSAHFLKRLSPPSSFPSSLPLSFFLSPFFRVDRALRRQHPRPQQASADPQQASADSDRPRVALTTVSTGRRAGAAKSINAFDAPTNHFILDLTFDGVLRAKPEAPNFSSIVMSISSRARGVQTRLSSSRFGLCFNLSWAGSRRKHPKSTVVIMT